MLAVIRLRGGIDVRHDMKATFSVLRLKRVNTMALLPEKKEIIGMVKKVESFVTWGEISDELKEKFDTNIIRLKPARGGLNSIKRPYPKGDLGYRGAAINELIERMM